MNHSWLLEYGHFAVSVDQIKGCLINFKNFRNLGPLQKAFLIYMVTTLFNEEDLDSYKHIFYTINKTCNGMLTREEFLKAYWGVGLKNMSEVELDRVLSYVDSD